MNKTKPNIIEHISTLPKTKPVFENFGIYIEDIHESLPRYNGSIYAIIGKGGSGKSSLFLSLFKSTDFLKCKFDEIHYIINEGSYNSVKNNPFKDHEKVHHEISPGLLYEIYEDALERKEESQKNKQPLEHTCIIIDDFGSELKNPDIQHALSTILIVARHAGLYVVLICQTYKMMPSFLRRILTNITLFRCNNEEWELICKEVLLKRRDTCTHLYNYVFDKLYNHLTVDIKTGEIRKIFNLLEIRNEN